MSNVFEFTSVTYFQVPEHVIDSGRWARLTHKAKDLYVLILRHAQRYSTTTLRLTSKDMARVGISRNSVNAAIESLDAEKLIHAKLGSHGYTFTLLDPATGTDLEAIKDLRAVKPEVVAMYFQDHIGGDYFITPNGRNITAACIFHQEKKRERSLNIDTDGGGAFKCHRCEAQGGILAFERAVAASKGEKITETQAYARVRAAHTRNARKLSKQREKQFAEALTIL